MGKRRENKKKWKSKEAWRREVRGGERKGGM